MFIMRFVKGLLIAPFCMALYVAYVVIGMAYGLFLIIGKPEFLERLTALITVVLLESFKEISRIFREFVFGKKMGS